MFVGAITKDVMTARSKRKMPSHYPAAVATYVKNVTESQMGADLAGLVRVLAEGTSVIAVSGQLMKEKNALFQAILESLREDVSSIPVTSELGRYLSDVEQAGTQYQQILVREMQTLLLQATGTDSPIIQTATPISEAEQQHASLEGVPSFSVNRALIGGVRVFHNGSVRDDSWRARLTQVLSAVRGQSLSKVKGSE